MFDIDLVASEATTGTKSRRRQAVTNGGGTYQNRKRQPKIGGEWAIRVAHYKTEGTKRAAKAKASSLAVTSTNTGGRKA